jgi:hypothetical protein
MAAEISLSGPEALARKMAVEIGLAGMASRKNLPASASRSVVDVVLSLVGCLTEPGIVC